MLLIPPSYSCNFLAKFSLVSGLDHTTPGVGFIKVSEKESRSKIADVTFLISGPLPFSPPAALGRTELSFWWTPWDHKKADTGNALSALSNIQFGFYWQPRAHHRPASKLLGSSFTTLLQKGWDLLVDMSRWGGDALTAGEGAWDPWHYAGICLQVIKILVFKLMPAS